MARRLSPLGPLLAALARVRLQRVRALTPADLAALGGSGDIVTCTADGTLVVISIGFTNADGSQESLLRPDPARAASTPE